MSYGRYVIGGLIYDALLMQMPTQWVVVDSVVLIGLAIFTGVKATRQKDPN